MILYNWQKIFSVAESNPVECFRIFKMHANREIPENKYDPIYSYSRIDFTGTSFLIHPDVFIFNSYKYCPRDLAIYLAIASLRPLGEYLATRKVTLRKVLCPIDIKSNVEDEELIFIEGDEIHFLYEETPKKLN